MPKVNLHGKTILVTGAAHGLGREIVLLLDKEGDCSFILVDRDEDGLSDLARLLSSRSRIMICDLSDVEERKKLITNAARAQILVNCAGVGSHSQLGQLSVEEIERVMQVNTLAPLELIAGLSPLELIVNIGSVSGEMNLPSMSLYAASKSSLHAFTRAIQLERARTLLVILGPLRGTDFVHSIAHPRMGQPQWYRDLDLSAEKAARLIVQSMKRGRKQLVSPWWYRVVFVLARWFVPLLRL